MSERTDPQFLNPSTLPKPPGYTQLVSVTGGRTIYIAGQVALDVDNKLVGASDLAAQTEQVFRNLSAALVAVGGDLSNVIKLTTFMRDIAGLSVFREVRDRFIPPGPKVPASTLFAISALFRPEFLIEIEAIAWLPK